MFLLNKFVFFTVILVAVDVWDWSETFFLLLLTFKSLFIRSHQRSVQIGRAAVYGSGVATGN